VQAVVNTRERKLGLVRECVREDVSDGEVNGFLVQIVLEGDETGVEGSSLGQDPVERGVG
jgi:hypothetical protein